MPPGFVDPHHENLRLQAVKAAVGSRKGAVTARTLAALAHGLITTPPARPDR